MRAFLPLRIVFLGDFVPVMISLSYLWPPKMTPSWYVPGLTLTVDFLPFLTLSTAFWIESYLQPCLQTLKTSLPFADAGAAQTAPTIASTAAAIPNLILMPLLSSPPRPRLVKHTRATSLRGPGMSAG